MDINKLQESVDFISAKFNEYEEDKKAKWRKTKLLEGNNLKMSDKVTCFEKQIDKKEQNSRRNCILLHGMPESKGEVADNITLKTICENINGNIITVDDIDRSHRIRKYDNQKKNLRQVIVQFTWYNAQEFFETKVS